MAKMKAAQIAKAGADFEIVERDIPQPGPGQVRIRVQACGVCHSDVFTKEGGWPGLEYPRVPGHEVAGVIDEPGPGVNSTVYAATKAGVDAITGVLAKELGSRKIRVNSISPGMIETEGVHATGFIGSDFQKMVETQSPLGRIGQPDDIAPTAVYLASADSRYMTGESLVLSGGLR